MVLQNLGWTNLPPHWMVKKYYAVRTTWKVIITCINVNIAEKKYLRKLICTDFVVLVGECSTCTAMLEVPMQSGTVVAN